MTDLMPNVTKVNAAGVPNVPTAIVTPCYLAGSLEIVGYTLPTATKLRQLLALLLTEAGKNVTVDTMVDEVWEDNPPRLAANNIQTYILHLRRHLGDAGKARHLQILRTTARGYMLRVAKPTLVDVHDFADTIKGARMYGDKNVDELRSALAIIEDASRLIRGAVLEDVKRGPVLQKWLQVFSETRRQALCLWIETALKLRKYREVIALLLPASLENPRDEDFARWLMLALYCSNRGREALSLYQKLRQAKVEDLGLDPGPSVQDLHQMILTGNRELFENPRPFI